MLQSSRSISEAAGELGLTPAALRNFAVYHDLPLPTSQSDRLARAERKRRRRALREAPTTSEAARRLGISRVALQLHTQRHDFIEAAHPSKLTEEEHGRRKHIVENAQTWDEAANAIGISASGVRNYARRHGLETPETI